MSAAFNKLPSLRTYAGAKTFHNLCTPIRGQASQPKPLGARSDWQRFRIRATQNPLQPNSEPSIECVLYKTPVVTYHPDNTVSITTGTDYTPSQSTAKFISELLGHCAYATCQANRIVLVTTNRTLTGDNQTHKYAIAAGQTLTFHLPNPANPHSRGLTPLDPTPQTTLVIDRAGANNVRKRYADFYRHLKATISLRTVNTNKDHPGYLTIPIQLSEYRDNLPTRPAHELGTLNAKFHRNDHWSFDLPQSQRMCSKPALNSTHDSFTDWHNKLSAFLTPLLNQQPTPEDQHTTFYRAFLTLAHWARFEHRQFFRHDEPDRTTFVAPDAIRALFDELLFKFHSNEVFTTRPVKTGQAPGTKYVQWVDWKTEKF
jgi:hypothetical protein